MTTPVQPSDAENDLSGRTIADRYKVLRPIGEGGIGRVYLAEHLALGRQVAIKVLHPQFASTEELRARFVREARSLGALSHPNIVTVVDFGDLDGTLFLVMELVDGETLDARLAREAFSFTTALDVIRQMLRALAAAHAQGIVHRDLKPGNILIRSLPDGSEHVVVLDFGLAKFADEPNSATITRKGAILGTPAYMAPEQSMGAVATPAADVYAAGLVAFEVLTRRRAFMETERSELVKAHVLTPPPKLADIGTEQPASPGLEAFIAHALEKRAINRFVDAGVMLAEYDLLPELAGRTGGTNPRISLLESGATSVVLDAPAATPASAITLAPMGKSRGIAVGLAVLVASGVTVAAVLTYLTRHETSTTPRDSAAPDASVLAANGHERASRDPWVEPVPPAIVDLRTRIGNGEHPSRTALRDLYRAAAADTHDPRPHLLLGRTYTDRGWFDDALDAYRDAHERDPSCIGDPNMVRDLIRIAASQRGEVRAGEYVITWFGALAIPTVDQALAGILDSESRVRLNSLRPRLLSSH